MAAAPNAAVSSASVNIAGDQSKAGVAACVS
ncbi:Uncharacterised protein [Mycobacteroides abscessus]|nr:Uncharacterised protein [Mycobacteroides abscessus]